MTRTQLVLDLPTPEGIRVVIVDDDEVVNVCLAMVLHRFGALIASGSATTVSEMFESATPYACVSEIPADEGETFAVVQKLRGPGANYTVDFMTSGLEGYLGPGPMGQSSKDGFEIFLPNPADAVELALSIASIADLGALTN